MLSAGPVGQNLHPGGLVQGARAARAIREFFLSFVFKLRVVVFEVERHGLPYYVLECI